MARLKHEQINTRKRLIVEWAVGGLAVLTAGCALAAGTTNVILNPELFAQKASDDQEKPFACTAELAEQTAQRAIECEKFLTQGRIALVGYDLTDVQLAELSNQTQQEINIVFGTNVSVAPVPANQITTDIVRQNSQHNGIPDCISTGSEESLVSLVAKQNMGSELQNFDAVIGVSALHDCNRLTRGLAAESEGQYAEVLGFDPESPDYAAQTAAHEMGHVFALGHSALFYDAPPKYPDQQNPLTYNMTPDGVFDIPKSISGATFDPYGEPCNVMGDTWNCETNIDKDAEIGITSDAASDDYPEINQIQRSFLQWPEVVLGQKASGTIDLQKQIAVFSTPGIQNSIAELALDNEIIFDGWNGGPDGTFTVVSFTTDCRPYNKLFSCVNIYLRNQESTVLVGTIESPIMDRSETFTIKLHSQSVGLTFYDDTIEIKDITER